MYPQQAEALYLQIRHQESDLASSRTLLYEDIRSSLAPRPSCYDTIHLMMKATDANSRTHSLTREDHLKARPSRPSSFEFVSFPDVSQPRNPGALSKIRRHAMKDIGYQRRKPKKRRYLNVPMEVPTEFTSELSRTTALQAAIGGGAAHTFFKFPISLDDTSTALVANMFRDTGDCLQTAHRKDWFPVGIADEATFYQILANSELHLEGTRNPHKVSKETPLSIHYHQIAIASVRKRLAANPTDVSDGIIGCISGFLVYPEIAGVFDRWLPQRKGILEAIGTRKNGFDSLEKHLRRSISWVELRGSFMQDIPAIIPLPQYWLDVHRIESTENTINPPCFPPRLQEAWRVYLPDENGVEILGIFTALAELATRVSLNKQGFRREDSFYDGIVVSANVLTHGLLNLRPTEDPTLDENSRHLLEACRLALLIFIGAVYKQYGAHPMRAIVHIEKLKDMLEQDDGRWNGFEEVRIWVLAMGAMEAHDEVTGRWFVGEMAKEAEEREAFLQELMYEMREVLWVPDLLDDKGEILESRIEQMRLEPGLAVQHDWNAFDALRG